MRPTDFFKIVTGNVSRSNKKKSFTLKKTRCRQYPTETMTSTDYTDNLALLANMSTQIKSLWHSLKWATGDIGLYENANKTEFMCFKQKGSIFTLSGKSLKLVNKFTYLGSNIPSTESYLNIHVGKAWSTINRLLIIRKSDLSDKIKCDFF